jgi:hypothetical protein
MKDYELTIEYSAKGSDKVDEKTINIDLQKYENSYQDRVVQMEQQHSRSEINKKIRPSKEQFVFDCISKNLSNNEELVSLIDPLVDKIDKYIIETK